MSMRKARGVVLAAVLAGGFAAPIAALIAGGAAAEGAADPAKMERAREAFRLALSERILGAASAQAAEGIVGNVAESLKARGATLPERDRSEMTARIAAGLVERLREKEEVWAAVYARNLTLEEIELLIEIYSRPEIAALLGKLPPIMEEGMAATQSDLQAVIAEVVGRMKAEGYLQNL